MSSLLELLLASCPGCSQNGGRFSSLMAGCKGGRQLLDGSAGFRGAKGRGLRQGTLFLHSWAGYAVCAGKAETENSYARLDETMLIHGVEFLYSHRLFNA